MPGFNQTKPEPIKLEPNTRGCTCATGNGLFTCQRSAVVKVGRLALCWQHARVRGVAVPP